MGNPQAFEILVLWAVPRSRSTAFEKMMRTRSDHECFHEPFGEPWYSGPEALAPEQRRNAVPSTYTYAEVTRRLRIAATKGPVFSKDFPHHVLHRWDSIIDGAPLASCMRHSFLIRDPRRQIASLYSKWPDLEERETGHEEQRELFDRLADEAGHPPPVVDADDLVADPERIITAWCNAVGITPDPNALRWEATGDPTNYSFYDDGSWHTKLADSTGIGQQVEDYPVDHTHPDIAAMVERAMVHYEHLHAHRLQGEDH